MRDGQATAREVQQIAAQAQQIAAQAQREAGQAVAAAGAQSGNTQGGNTSVIKDGSGRIVVTANGKTITIDPKAGLDEDQIQDVVQTALHPAPPPGAARGPNGGDIVAITFIAFAFLFAIVWLITRTIRGRPVAAGPATAALAPEAAARLARIEQAVEAVAIEVERISEAQRYSAQLLTDRLSGPAPTAPAIAGAARPDGR